MAADWAVRGSNPGRGKKFLVPKRPEPGALLLNGYRGSFPGVKRPGLEVTTHLHLMKRLRMNGVIPIIPVYAFTVWTGNASLQLA